MNTFIGRLFFGPIKAQNPTPLTSVVAEKRPKAYREMAQPVASASEVHRAFQNPERHADDLYRGAESATRRQLSFISGVCARTG